MVASSAETTGADAVAVDDESVLERLPNTVLLAAFGVLLVAAGFGMDYLGFDTVAGVTGALAAVLIAIAVLGQLVVWTLARL